jgi:dihydroflavonol-4-reductase
MRYLLTGGTGFVGANVVRHLLKEGHSVRCVVRKPNLCLEGLPVEWVKVGLEDEEGLLRASDGCAGIFHVAGTFDPGPGGEDLMRRIHVDATALLCKVAKRAGVPRVLVCSSSITVGFGSVEHPGNEDSPLDAEATYGQKGALRVYHDSKLESEEIARSYGGVIVNPDYVLGAWDIKPTSGQLLLTMARHPVPVYPRGGKCFIDADDCAIGHLRAMERGQPGRRYLLGNHNLPYQAFMALCAEVAGRRAPFLPVPGLALRVAGRVGSGLQRLDAHRFAGLERHVLLAMQQDRYRSGRRSWEELGVPRTPLRESVEKAWRWFGEHGYLK